MSVVVSRLVSAAALAFMTNVSLAAPNSDQGCAGPHPHAEIGAFLRALYNEHEAPDFRCQFVDLNGDNRNEAVVYVDDRKWCGSGGCLLLVLKLAGATYQMVGRTTTVWPPIRVLDHRTKGWRDIAVRVRGGGIIPGYEAVLTFDGKRYPPNPTVHPARRASGNQVGQTLSDLSD